MQKILKLEVAKLSKKLLILGTEAIKDIV